MLTDFSGVPGSGLAGPFATYVSYDATGLLYMSSGASLAGGSTAVTGVDPVQCVTGYPAMTPDTVNPARCGTDRAALRMFATGGTFVDASTGLVADPNDAGLTGWGMNAGTDLRQDCTGGGRTDSTGTNGPCYFDATGWTGISFWAMAGPGTTGTSALVTVADPNTAGVLGGMYPYNDLTCGNEACVPPPAVPDNHCTAASVPLCLCDPFGKAFGLVDHWAFYAIPFSDMRQKGYGAPEPAIDVTRILGFKVSLGPGTWNVYIDNVAFYRPKGD